MLFEQLLIIFYTKKASTNTKTTKITTKFVVKPQSLLWFVIRFVMVLLWKFTKFHTYRTQKITYAVI